MNVLGKIKLRLGDLWWYTLVMFVVQRVGDVINAFIGLWLVPKYVPQEELGALLPLSQVGAVLALPLSVMAVTFSKFVNKFATRGEYGKVKSLIRDVFVLVTIIFVAAIFYARFAMPLVFERMRVADGRLGLLVVASGVLSVAATFFTNALQALKKFRLITLIGFVGAPLRLVTLLICFPIRALSGYFVGQIVPTVYGICAALFGTKNYIFNRQLHALPYIRQDGLDMLKYTIPVALGVLCNSLQSLAEAFVVRQRLSALESAGYYLISRFAEIGAYVGITVIFVLFPLVSEHYEKGGNSQKAVLQGVSVTFLAGFSLTVFLWVFGRQLLVLVPAWKIYEAFAPHMAVLAMICTLRATMTCFLTYEIGCNRFGVFLGNGIICVSEAVFLFCVTGFSFFAPWVSGEWIEWVASLRVNRLEIILNVMFVFALIPIFIMFAQILKQRMRRAIHVG